MRGSPRTLVYSFHIRPKGELGWGVSGRSVCVRGCHERQTKAKAATGADVAAGSRRESVSGPGPVAMGPSWGMETRRIHLLLSRYPRSLAGEVGGGGREDERQRRGCSTDVTCWGSAALASKCHVWQLVRCSLSPLHQLLAERLLKDAKDACTGAP
ncbi:hypothetical protein AOLI_G00124490 [Acnodon oligacanthus]